METKKNENDFYTTDTLSMSALLGKPKIVFNTNNLPPSTKLNNLSPPNKSNNFFPSTKLNNLSPPNNILPLHKPKFSNSHSYRSLRLSKSTESAGGDIIQNSQSEPPPKTPRGKVDLNEYSQQYKALYVKTFWEEILCREFFSYYSKISKNSPRNDPIYNIVIINNLHDNVFDYCILEEIEKQKDPFRCASVGMDYIAKFINISAIITSREVDPFVKKILKMKPYTKGNQELTDDDYLTWYRYIIDDIGEFISKLPRNVHYILSKIIKLCYKNEVDEIPLLLSIIYLRIISPIIISRKGTNNILLKLVKFIQKYVNKIIDEWKHQDINFNVPSLSKDIILTTENIKNVRYFYITDIDITYKTLREYNLSGIQFVIENIDKFKWLDKFQQESKKHQAERLHQMISYESLFS